MTREMIEWAWRLRDRQTDPVARVEIGRIALHWEAGHDDLPPPLPTWRRWLVRLDAFLRCP